ncbi:hypothetical protein NM688_g5250 [Phlebia brevispora]|uniref:Uncharacterized protein n=1 Tax=Phlebia brevispora TaxID=194682 RepID=A0ACC1SYD7_9APHY|nr:hypothetical protein NM688_g5250 [Phlebia brevispora]
MALLRVITRVLLAYALYASSARASTSSIPSSTDDQDSKTSSVVLTGPASTPVLSATSSDGAFVPTTTSIAENQPSPTANQTTLDDISVMTGRRLTFIIAGAGDPSSIEQWLSTLGPDGKWPDSEVDYTAGCDGRRANWPAQTHWQRIVTMAAAWHGGLVGADQFAQNTTLLDAISLAMDFWFSNDFTNPSCLDSGGKAACPCGTPGFWNTNWFSNIILIPNLVAQACLLISRNLSNSELGNCTHITERSYQTLGTNVNGLGIPTGANLLDIARIGIDEGLLNVNATVISDAYQRIHAEVVIENATESDGIRADGSFGQHGGVLYNGNYGKDFANDVLLLEIDAGGTQFAAGPTTESVFATLIDGDQWMIYRNVITGVLHWDFVSIPVASTSDQQATGSININVTEIAQLGTEWNSSVLTSVSASLSTNSSTANIGDIKGNRMFFDNDYMVQRGPGYVTTVKMYSPRTKNTECLNSQNPLGFHLSDGTVYTYLQGDEYEDIAAAWDWNLIPGITVDYNATVLSCNEAQFSGLSSFVGGASNGQVGVATMSFTNPLTQSLSWQKAWFFFADDVQRVMIPAVTSTSGALVFSVLDQKRHNGPVFVDGLPLGPTMNFTKPLSLWHDNVGYAFDQSHTAAKLSVEVGLKSGNWSDIGISAQGVETVDLFAAWLDHGSSTPFAPTYYTVFPAVDQKSFLKRLSRLQVDNIQNDGDVSAVYDAKHHTAMLVFWNPAGGSARFVPGPQEAAITVKTTGNAAVIYEVKQGNVTVSDPSQTLTSLNLTISIDSMGKKPSVWRSGSTKELEFQLPQGGLAGSSISQKL